MEKNYLFWKVIFPPCFLVNVATFLCYIHFTIKDIGWRRLTNTALVDSSPINTVNVNILLLSTIPRRARTHLCKEVVSSYLPAFWRTHLSVAWIYSDPISFVFKNSKPSLGRIPAKVKQNVFVSLLFFHYSNSHFDSRIK